MDSNQIKYLKFSNDGDSLFKIPFSPADVEAAPAGYGYEKNPVFIAGEQSDNDGYRISSETELDDALNSVLSAMGNNETKLIRFYGYPTSQDYNWFGILSKSSNNYSSLWAQSAFTYGTFISKSYGYKNGSGTSAVYGWHPLEWINPPMIANTEYRTTERWDGKPVYKKIVKYTQTELKAAIQGTSTTAVTLASNYFNIPHGISNIDIMLSCNAMRKKGAETWRFPSINPSKNTDDTVNWNQVKGASAVVDSAGASILLRIIGDSFEVTDGSNPDWYFDLKYTKTS